MAFKDGIERLVGTAIDRISVSDQPDPFDFTTLRCAIVIFHATWSGPSVKVVRDYSAAYLRLFPAADCPVTFHVLDWDKLSQAYYENLPGTFGGNGETFFVRDGRIIHNIPFYITTIEDELLKTFGIYLQLRP